MSPGRVTLAAMKQRVALAAGILAAAWGLGGAFPQAAAGPAVADATLLWTAADIGQAEIGPAGERAVLITRPLAAPFPFRNALPSWNGSAPEGTGMRLAIRVRPVLPASPSPRIVPVVVATPSSYVLVPASDSAYVAGEGDWSPWLSVGDWGDAAPPMSSDETLQWGSVKVDVDTLLLGSPATEVQWRITLSRRPNATQSPRLTRLAMHFTGDATTPEAQAWLAAHPEPVSDWTGVWPVPFRSQKTDDARMKSSLCSPTTTYMALAYAGAEMPDLETFSRRVYDRTFDMFGVWPRAVAAASERGLPGYVTRIRSFGHLRALLSRGYVVGASIRFKKEDLRRPPSYSTAGHLVLIRGVLPSGEIVTNDPNSTDTDTGEGFRWLPEDFSKAWFGKGGVAYVFEVPGKR